MEIFFKVLLHTLRRPYVVLFLLSSYGLGNETNNTLKYCGNADLMEALVSEESASCESAYKLGKPFLEDFRLERQKRSQKALGVFFQNSLRQDLNTLAQANALYLNLGLNLNQAPDQKCQLQEMKRNLPCKDTASSQLKALMGDQFESLDQFYQSLGDTFRLGVDDHWGQGETCFSPALRRKIHFETFMRLHKEKSLKEFIESLEGEKTTTENLGATRELLESFWPDGAQVLAEVDPEKIPEGDFEEQLSWVMKQNDTQEKIHKSLDKVCVAMEEKLTGLLCRPVSSEVIKSPQFNKLVFNYDPSPHESGFDGFEADFADIGAATSFSHYALNCQPPCKECAGQTSVDDVLERHLNEDIYRLTGESEKEFPSNDVELDHNMCEALACIESSCRPTHFSKEKATSLKRAWGCERGVCSEEQKSFLSIVSKDDPVEKMTDFGGHFLGAKTDSQGETDGDSVGLSQGGPQELSPLKVASLDPFAQDQESYDNSLRGKKSSRGREEQSRGFTSYRHLYQKHVPRSGIPSLGGGHSFSDEREDYGDPDDTDVAIIKAMRDYMKSSQEFQARRDYVTVDSLNELARANKSLGDRLSQKLGEQEGRLGQDTFAENMFYPQRKNPEDSLVSPFKNFYPERPNVEGVLNQNSDEVAEGENELEKASPSRISGRSPAALGDGALSSSLDKGLSGNSWPEVEVRMDEIKDINDNKLETQGVEVEKPFVILVRVQGRLLSVPVRPFVFKGEEILAPVIDNDNVVLVDLLRQSPLFKSYYAFEGERQEKNFSLNHFD